MGGNVFTDWGRLRLVVPSNVLVVLFGSSRSDFVKDYLDRTLNFTV